MSNFGTSTEIDQRQTSPVGDGTERVSETGEAVSRAFPTPESIATFVTRLKQDNNQRNTRNAKITRKLNSEQPWDPAELKAAGLSWKSNFTTRPLNTLVSKVVGRFPRAVNSARFLTASALPPGTPGEEKKTEYFRRKLTLFLRAQPGWDDLVNSLAHETVLFGYTASASLDDDEILPKPFRQDQFFVPAATRQVPGHASAVVLHVDVAPHIAFKMLQDGRKSAAAVGDSRWDVAAFADAINNALPENRRASGTSAEARFYEDLYRQVNQGTSFVGSEKVRLFHLLAAELSGKVSHFITDDSGKLLFTWLDQFGSMAEATSFFSFEYADGTLHGSKGLGRTAYAFATVLDRSRNDAVDRMQLAGKLVLQGPDNNATRLKMNVVGNVVTFSSDWTINSARIDANIEASVTLDDYLRRLLDEMSGSVSPTSFTGRDRVTKEEIDLLASREGERSDDVLGRWLQQFGAMVTGVQRRVLDPATTNPTVRAFQQELLTTLSPEELEYLRTSPALSVVQDLSNIERQSIITAATETMGNPLVDNKRLLWEKLSAQVSPEFANRILLPDDDQTVTAEAVRMQQLENVALGSGLPIPVSPRDNHKVHLATLLPLFASALQTASANPQQLGSVQFILQHAKEHLALAAQQKINDPELQEIAMQVNQVEKAVQQLSVSAQDAAAATQTGSPVDPGAVGQPDEGAPVGARAPVA